MPSEERDAADAGAPESLLERLELSIALAGLDAAEGGAVK